MYRHRDTSSTIWRTVVFAGAMLGTPACGHDAKPVQTTPPNTAATPPPADPTPAPTPTVPAKPDPTPAAAEAEPCGGGPMPMNAKPDDPQPADATAQPQTNDKKRPRGGGSRPTGRGFVLA